MKSKLKGYSCVVTEPIKDMDILVDVVSSEFDIIKIPMGSLVSRLKKEHYHLVVLCLQSGFFYDYLEVLSTIKNIRSVPFIVILENEDLEIARICGRIGIDYVLCKKDIGPLRDILLRIRNNSDTAVRLTDLGISLEYDSPRVRSILQFIEKNYLTLSGVCELASRFNVHENTVIREFSRHNLMSPKQLLLRFKVIHAVNLMRKNNMSIKEIAHHSGFVNLKGFIRAFYKFHRCSPNSYYRDRIKKFQLVI